MDEALGQLQVVRAGSGWQDRFRSYDVVVDGSPVARLARGESCTVSLSSGSHQVELRISAWGSRPLTVDVGPGRMTRLRCRPAAGLRPFCPGIPRSAGTRGSVWSSSTRRPSAERIAVVAFLVCDLAPLVYAATRSWFWERHSVAPAAAAVESLVVAALLIGRRRWAWVVLTALFGLVVVGWALTGDRFQLSSLTWAVNAAIAFAILLSRPMRGRLRHVRG